MTGWNIYTNRNFDPLQGGYREALWRPGRTVAPGGTFTLILHHYMTIYKNNALNNGITITFVIHFFRFQKSLFLNRK